MMAATVLTKLMLSAIFIVAGLAKIASPGALRRTLADFGMPAWIGAPIAVLLPLVELAAGAGLLLPEFSWYAAGIALGLVATFIAAITVALLRGRKPECNCFGHLHSKPIGWNPVARNVGLALAAGLILDAAYQMEQFLGSTARSPATSFSSCLDWPA